MQRRALLLKDGMFTFCKIKVLYNDTIKQTEWERIGMGWEEEA